MDIASQKNMLVVWNPSSVTQEAEMVRERFAQRDDVRLVDPGGPEEMTDSVEQALRDEVNIIVAAGGDGTAHSVANCLIEASSSIPMCVIPLGTGNDLCRTLAIPPDPLEAVDLLDSGRTVALDAVYIQGAEYGFHYINVASGGFSSQVMKAITDEVKERWKKLAYLRSAAAVMSESEPFEVTIQYDDAPSENITAVNIILGNGRYSAGGLPVAPMANPQDGLLDVILLQDGSWSGIMGVITSLVNDTLHECESVVYRRAQKVRIEAEPKLVFSADGELVAETPTVATVHPHALNVIVGSGYTADSLYGDNMQEG
jgi:diacylglycerol kinase (ATP)